MINKDTLDINGIVQFIVSHVKSIKMITMFGSIATNSKGNDLDLALVTNSCEDNLKELDLNVGRKIENICKKYPIDYFVLPINLIKKHKNSIFFNMIDTTGRILYMDKESINEWIDDAKLDYNQSIYLFHGGYYKGACYHAQQCVEKLLKAKLLHFKWELKKVYSVLFLMSELKSYGFTIENVSDDDLHFMNNIYKGRYPGESGLLPYGPPSKIDAQKSLSIAFKIGTAMGLTLNPLENDN